MIIERTSLPAVLVVKVDVHGDDRGFFMETWHERRFAEAGIDLPFVQDNYSRSSRHTLRGLHYQVEQAQGKLVRVLEGEAYDVLPRRMANGPATSCRPPIARRCGSHRVLRMASLR